MAGRRIGWSDTYRDARLTNLTGTTYPASPAQLFIALYRGLPLSDGSDAASLEVAVTRAGPITFTAPASGGGSEGTPVYRTIQPTAGVSFTAPGIAGSGASTWAGAWGILTASSGGTLIYTGEFSMQLVAGIATTIPASLFQIAAESI
jgi:hypothetical protein